jgi:hypothetical protein
MTKRCVWSGRSFPAVTRGGQEKVFADDRARAEAHLAARKYAEAMIDSGLLSWEQIKRWYDRHKKEKKNGHQE